MKIPDNPYLPNTMPELVRQLTTLWQGLSQQINQLSEGQAVATYNAVAAMPTTGTFYIGDFVQNSAPAVLGGAGNQYVIQGWKRITNGSAHVLNTDWVQVRTLTGT